MANPADRQTVGVASSHDRPKKTWLGAMEGLVPGFASKQAVILDMDGTLTGTVSGNICANVPEDAFPLPNTLKYVRQLAGMGKFLVLWTSQGGVGHGIMSVMTAS